ncbi:MAG: hypothetical protein ABJV68_05230 [Paracoccaceae bacterium]
MVDGHHSLSLVFFHLHKQVKKRGDYFWNKLQQSSETGNFPPSSSFSKDASDEVWEGPNFEAVTSGIALSILFHVVLQEGLLIAKNRAGHLTQLPPSDLLFLEVDPPIAPTIIRQPCDVYSFFEFRPESRTFAFVDASTWSIRYEPKLENCQSEADVQNVQGSWIGTRPFAGAEIFFRSSVSFVEDKPISPSQIAQRCRSVIDAIVLGKAPRANSLLFDRYVEEAALCLAVTKPNKSVPVTGMARTSPNLPRVYEVKLPLLANLKLTGVDFSDKTNRGLRALRDSLKKHLRSEG